MRFYCQHWDCFDSRFSIPSPIPSPSPSRLTIDKLLLEHIGLPHVLGLAVHLVNLFGWMSQGVHSEPLLLLECFYQSTPSCLKVMGGWWPM